MPEKRVTLGVAEETNEALPLRVSLRTPLAWIVDGFLRSVDRFHEEAAKPQETAQRVYAPIFELLNWAVSLHDYLREHGGASNESLGALAALRFVRNTAHHRWAAPLYFDKEQNEWCWYTADLFPPATERRYEQPTLERRYRAQFVGKPAREAIDTAAAFARTLV